MLSKKDQRIADAKKNRKEIMEKLQAKVDKDNDESTKPDETKTGTKDNRYFSSGNGINQHLDRMKFEGSITKGEYSKLKSSFKGRQMIKDSDIKTELDSLRSASSKQKAIKSRMNENIKKASKMAWGESPAGDKVKALQSEISQLKGEIKKAPDAFSLTRDTASGKKNIAWVRTGAKNEIKKLEAEIARIIL